MKMKRMTTTLTRRVATTRRQQTEGVAVTSEVTSAVTSGATSQATSKATSRAARKMHGVLEHAVLVLKEAGAHRSLKREMHGVTHQIKEAATGKETNRKRV